MIRSGNVRTSAYDACVCFERTYVPRIYVIFILFSNSSDLKHTSSALQTSSVYFINCYVFSLLLPFLFFITPFNFLTSSSIVFFLHSSFYLNFPSFFFIFPFSLFSVLPERSVFPCFFPRPRENGECRPSCCVGLPV